VSIRFAFLTCVVLASSVARASADDAAPQIPGALGLAQALTIFRGHGLDLLIADANIASAEGDVTAAGALNNPTLSVSYGPSFYYSCANAAGCPRPPGALAVQVSDQAVIEDVVSGKRRLRGDVARAALEAAKLGRRDAERTLVFQVKAQFAQLLLAQNTLKFAQDTADANALMLDKTEKQRQADKIQRPDLLRVKVAKLESDQAVDQARLAVPRARTALAFLLGARAGIPEFVAVAPELEHYGVPASLAALDHDALLAQAYASRPDLAAQQAMVTSATAGSALARRQRFPDISLSLGYSQQGTTDTAASPPTVTLGLSAAIPVFYRQAGEIQRADANARTQALQVEKLRAQIRNDFELAYAEVLAAQALVRRMEDGQLLATARQAKDDIQLLYEKGSAQLTDYLLALATYITTNIEYLNDVAGYWTALFELEQALGKELT
jgi:cobalt-zinc-cadmium efflux system outer membrane protein